MTPRVLAFLLFVPLAMPFVTFAQGGVGNPGTTPSAPVTTPSAPVTTPAAPTTPVAVADTAEQLMAIAAAVLVTLAALFVVLLVLELRAGGHVAIESSWGGFGGGMGGWRLSTPLVYLIIVVLFGAMGSMALSRLRAPTASAQTQQPTTAPQAQPQPVPSPVAAPTPTPAPGPAPAVTPARAASAS
jgi:hypothetical protein